jgi:hypothetical protein
LSLFVCNLSLSVTRVLDSEHIKHRPAQITQEKLKVQNDAKGSLTRLVRYDYTRAFVP